MRIRDVFKSIGLSKVCRDRSMCDRCGPIRDNGNAKAFPISSGVRDIPLETMAIQKNCLSPTGYMLHGKAFEIRQGFFHVAMKIK